MTDVTTELDPAWVEEFLVRWTEAWNSHEPARLLELMTEDIVYDDSSWPATMRGHGEVRAFLDHAWRAFPDLRFEVASGPYIVPARRSRSTARTSTSTATGACAGYGSCST